MITQQEFEEILADTSKRALRVTLSGARMLTTRLPASFGWRVRSDAGWPLLVVGRYNPYAGKLSYVLLHRGAGRIYGLDLGADHHNPSCQRVGEKHKHRWTEAFRGKEAYVPSDITAGWNEPVEVWVAVLP